MKNLIFTLTLFILTTVLVWAQRGGTNYTYSNPTGQAQFSSMATLNRGDNAGQLRPNANQGIPPSNSNLSSGAGHHHHHHYNNTPVHHNSTVVVQYIHEPVVTSHFESWLHSMSYQANNAVRLNMAMDYVSHHWLTTHQIHDILELFNNESSMLMIAEQAYFNTCDPYNYHELYRCFSNSACVLHLQNFVANQ